MTTYDNLPIYHASYSLLLELFRFTRDFSREYQYTRGESIKKETVEMITHIYEKLLIDSNTLFYMLLSP